MSWRIITADALEGLRSLPDGSVHCITTSPPYWGLRDYGTAVWEGGDPECTHRHDTEHQKQGATSARKGRTNSEAQRNENFRGSCARCGALRVDHQLGLEPTPGEYVAKVVEIFREARRALRDDGTLWLNLGDSYAGNRSYQVPDSKNKHHVFGVSNALGVPAGLKPKDLVGIPWMIAFALQADGWYLRADIVWAKPNPMPESVRDRPTKAHEYLFLLSKSPRYFYDQEAIRELSETDPRERYEERAKVLGRGMQPGSRASTAGPQQDNSGGFPLPAGGRNARSVWTIATHPYPEAHFATFPPELPRRCILAGTSERGCCPECGAPWERVVDRYRTRNGERADDLGAWRNTDPGAPIGAQGDGHWRYATVAETKGWAPTCDHEAERTPCTVLDPFAGSGTTGMVARQLGRHFVGIELSPEYAAMAERRIGEACAETVLERGGKLAPILGPLFDQEL